MKKLSFWNKRSDATYKALLRVFELLQVEVKVLQKDIELINGKLRKKIYKPASKEEELEVSNPPIDDGFDELRKLNKESKMYL